MRCWPTPCILGTSTRPPLVQPRTVTPSSPRRARATAGLCRHPCRPNLTRNTQSMPPQSHPTHTIFNHSSGVKGNRTNNNNNPRSHSRSSRREGSSHGSTAELEVRTISLPHGARKQVGALPAAPATTGIGQPHRRATVGSPRWTWRGSPTQLPACTIAAAPQATVHTPSVTACRRAAASRVEGTTTQAEGEAPRLCRCRVDPRPSRPDQLHPLASPR